MLIIINDVPYGSEQAYNALRLALTLRKEHTDIEIQIFLMADAVLCALPHQKTPNGYYTVERMLKGLVQKDVQVKACGTCADTLSTMSQLAAWVAAADNVLSF